MNSEYPYLTELDIEHRINNMKTSKFFLYPKDEIFDKELVALDKEFEKAKTMIYDFYENCKQSAIIAQALETPVEELTELSKIGILVGAGIPMSIDTEGRFKTIYDIKIELVDGKYHVYYKLPPFSNTYC
jgi:hypothetical protein